MPDFITNPEFFFRKFHFNGPYVLLQLFQGRHPAYDGSNNGIVEYSRNGKLRHAAAMSRGDLHEAGYRLKIVIQPVTLLIYLSQARMAETGVLGRRLLGIMLPSEQTGGQRVVYAYTDSFALA